MNTAAALDGKAETGPEKLKDSADELRFKARERIFTQGSPLLIPLQTEQTYSKVRLSHMTLKQSVHLHN